MFRPIIHRNTQNQRLLQLSQSANDCKNVLNRKLDVARRLIQMSELSRKMETLVEQVLLRITCYMSINTQKIVF